MKVLVITHGNNSIYGAATSLKFLLQNCGWEYDLVYSKYLKKKNRASEKDMREYANNTVNNLWELYLPHAEWAVNTEFSFYLFIRSILLFPFFFVDRIKLRRIIEQGGYDYIILNSLSLFPIITHDKRFVLFIREPCVAPKWKMRALSLRLNKAHKIIFIDESLVSRVGEISVPFKVINNPFDMTGMRNIKLQEVQKEFAQIDYNKIVLTIAGIVIPVKGVDFVIDAFKRTLRKDIQLLVVGRGEDSRYLEQCKRQASGDDRILFLGEQQDMRKIYMISDYIIRAEKTFVTGRTVYEGLYSGCNVILQYIEPRDVDYMQEYQRFREKIVLYKARDEESLSKALDRLPSKKIGERVYSSNVHNYVKTVTEFINE